MKALLTPLSGKSRLFHLVILLLLQTLSNYTHGQQWTEVWSDEFEYNGLPDPNKWGYQEGCGIINNEAQNYTKGRLENSRVENGKLILEARKEASGSCNYSSASILTKRKGEWLYGKIEVSAMLPQGRGMWPAIWMMPSDDVYGGWPKSGEIDIMEQVGMYPGELFHTVHFENGKLPFGDSDAANHNNPSIYNSFHKYSLEWDPDSLCMFVDDVKKYTYRKNGNDYKKWPFDQKFHLILNVAVGGSWGGQEGIDDAIFPQKMQVEYVRVYQRQTSPGPYSLRTSANKGGKVEYQPVKNNYASGDRVTVTAVADPGYRFVQWKGVYPATLNPLPITIKKEENVEAVFVKQEEILLNGYFQSGNDNWEFYAFNGAIATNRIQGDSSVIDIKNGGVESWNIQLLHTQVPISTGKEYTLSFNAVADKNISFNAVVGKAATPFNAYSVNTVSAGRNNQLFSYTFTMKEPSDPAARLVFDLGGQTGKITLSNISLVEVARATALELGLTAHLTLTPNPAVDNLHISYSSLETGVLSMKLLNVYGQEQISIFDGTTKHIERDVNISGLSSGIYVINTVLSGEVIKQEKFVKY